MLTYWWKHERHVKIEKLWMAIAWRLPKTLVMWCTVRLLAHATTGEYGATNPGELGAMEALSRWPAK